MTDHIEDGGANGLTHVNEDDCMLDVDELAWRRILQHRGGCKCCISPPCSACVEPITEEELNREGYTYEPNKSYKS